MIVPCRSLSLLVKLISGLTTHLKIYTDGKANRSRSNQVIEDSFVSLLRFNLGRADPKGIGWEVFYEKQKPHWLMFGTRQFMAVKIICFELFGRASSPLSNEYQVKSKAVLEQTEKSNTFTTM